MRSKEKQRNISFFYKHISEISLKHKDHKYNVLVLMKNKQCNHLQSEVKTKERTGTPARSVMKFDDDVVQFANLFTSELNNSLWHILHFHSSWEPKKILSGTSLQPDRDWSGRVIALPQNLLLEDDWTVKVSEQDTQLMF